MSDGTGFDTAPAGPSHSTMAAANASQQQGNGKLLGPRSARDVSRDQNAKRSVPPPPMPASSATRWSPRQPVGNPKGERL